MSNIQSLSEIKHKDLRVIMSPSVEKGDAQPAYMAFPTEFPKLVREFPILFKKNEAGEFQAFAITGFDVGENLVLDRNGWQARAIPYVLAKGPFLLGLQKDADPMVSVDLDNPKISLDGTPVFLEHGGNSVALESAILALKGIHEGVALASHMYKCFEKYDLFESVELEFDISDDYKHRMTGFYAITESALERLDKEGLHDLHQNGFLRAAFNINLSLQNFDYLVELKKKAL